MEVSHNTTWPCCDLSERICLLGLVALVFSLALGLLWDCYGGQLMRYFALQKYSTPLGILMILFCYDLEFRRNFVEFGKTASFHLS